MPMIRRIPKRGFTFTPKPRYQVVSLESLAKFAAGTEVNPEVLKNAKLVGSKDPRVKILGDGNLKHALTIKAHAFSRSALEKIKTAGGKAQVIAVGVAASLPKTKGQAAS